MSCHDDFDAARAHRPYKLLDRLRGGGIQTRGGFIEKQYPRLTSQGPREREALLLATGKPTSWAISQALKINKRQQFVRAALACTSGYSGRGERKAKVTECAATEHYRTLKNDGAPQGR